MTKFTIEEKKAVQLYKDGYNLAEVRRKTGISEGVIRSAFNQSERHSWEAQTRLRYDWSAEEKRSILQEMKANCWSCAETSIQYGIKGSSTIWEWAE